MKSKQLANVLIKMLGLSVCLYAIPNFISNLLIGLSFFGPLAHSDGSLTTFSRALSSFISAALQAFFGLFLICKSRKVAGWMIKNEDD
jgi:hypothetical protein